MESTQRLLLLVILDPTFASAVEAKLAPDLKEPRPDQDVDTIVRH